MFSSKDQIKPIKLGVKFDPASVILIYEQNEKLRSRQIPAKNLDFLTDLRSYAEKFKENPKNKKFLEKVTLNKMEKILSILQDNMRGYTLDESLSRAKKFDESIEKNSPNNSSNYDTEENSELFGEKKKSLPKLDDYDDDDFHDSDDEEKNSKSVSTIEDVKAKKDSLRKNSIENFSFEKPDNNKTKSNNQAVSKSDALNLLSNQIKSVKSNIYDFEDEIPEEINDEDEHDKDDDDDESDEDEDEDDEFSFTKKKKNNKKKKTKMKN